jgi:molybdopterin-guanine dinucleotide biosynthesis protein A
MTGEDLASCVGGLLVGGESRRMGEPKALALLAGRSLAERAAAALAEVPLELVLIGAGPVPPALAGLARLPDAPGARGPMAAVLAALRARPDAAWLLVACDQALVSAAACRWLLAARRAGTLGVLPRLGSGPAEPLLAIYEPTARAPLELQAARGERSLQPFARLAGVLSPEPPSELASAWTSLDSPSDIERAVRRLERARRAADGTFSED